MNRLLLTATFVCGVLAISLAGGCSHRKAPPQMSNAYKSKAEKARKQAELLACSVISGTMKHQARSTSGGPSSITVISPQGITQIKAEPPAPLPEATAQTKPLAQPPAKAAPPASPPGSPAAMPSAQSQVNTVTENPNRPTSPLRPGPAAVIRERVSSSPLPNDADAEEDVLMVAQNLIEQRLAQLDPPVTYRPSLNEVRKEFVRKDSRSSRKPSDELRKIYADVHKDDPSYSEKLRHISYDVEVTSDQIRHLRTRDRITMVFRAFAGVTLAALACLLLLRADEWTKGYLTHWLGFAAVALVGGIVAAILLV